MLKLKTCLFNFMGCAILLAGWAFFAPRVFADPCGDEIEKNCGTIQPGLQDLASCIDDKIDQFTAECRDFLQKSEGSLNYFREACGFDVDGFCKSAKPGSGRVEKCLLENIDKLSEECRSVIQPPDGLTGVPY